MDDDSGDSEEDEDDVCTTADKTRQFCLVSDCVHTANADQTRQFLMFLHIRLHLESLLTYLLT